MSKMSDAADTIVPQPEEARVEWNYTDHVPVLRAPQSIQAESIGALRSHLLAKHLQDGRRSLAICGATEGVGVSFVAANLAAAFALAGVNTLLVDGNMREPGLHHYFVPPRAVRGLSDFLADPDLIIHDFVRPAGLENLAVLSAGTPVDNPQDLLASRQFSIGMDACMRDYDLVIVDTPPSSLSADARRIAAAMRYALIVARKDVSFVSDLKVLTEELRADRAKVVGTYLNDYYSA
jgi:protein-tyrosine kinase